MQRNKMENSTSLKRNSRSLTIAARSVRRSIQWSAVTDSSALQPGKRSQFDDTDLLLISAQKKIFLFRGRRQLYKTMLPLLLLTLKTRLPRYITSIWTAREAQTLSERRKCLELRCIEADRVRIDDSGPSTGGD